VFWRSRGLKKGEENAPKVKKMGNLRSFGQGICSGNMDMAPGKRLVLLWGGGMVGPSGFAKIRKSLGSWPKGSLRRCRNLKRKRMGHLALPRVKEMYILDSRSTNTPHHLERGKGTVWFLSRNNKSFRDNGKLPPPRRIRYSLGRGVRGKRREGGNLIGLHPL